MSVTAAITQITSRSSIASNLLMCRRVVQRAAEEGAKVVFLPEASDFILSTGHTDPSLSSAGLSKPLNDSNEFLEGMKEQARESGVWISVGLHESAEDQRRCYNTSVLINNEGQVLQSYRKLHLFDVDVKPDGPTILESKSTVQGKEILPPVETPLGKLGSLICYDLRFPEPSLRLRRMGAQVISYPSAFTMKTGAAHWETLLKTRAIETQSYIFASAQVGYHLPLTQSSSLSLKSLPNPPPRVSYGRALAIDPWGDIIARLPSFSDDYDSEDPEDGLFALCHVNLEYLEKCRREMPLWEQRRADVYPEM
ncbi:putative NIT2-nitrilase [Atractiella rhizophila]|nr:putative NIT2-nitrilase [Atractiella rhizophila]